MYGWRSYTEGIRDVITGNLCQSIILVCYYNIRAIIIIIPYYIYVPFNLTAYVFGNFIATIYDHYLLAGPRL